jgi:hypothetical protein
MTPDFSDRPSLGSVAKAAEALWVDLPVVLV